MQRGRELKLVYFEGRLEVFFPDGSLLCKNKFSLTYYTTKGNKVRVTIDTLKHSQEIREKIQIVADKLNFREDQYYVVLSQDEDLQTEKDSKHLFKKYKITEFCWETSLVRQSQQGWEVRSDDGNATVTLQKDLYEVVVRYLQRTGGRKITEDGILMGRKNRRKELIEKYGGKYVQYPQQLVNVQIEHQYVSLSKSFTILTLPQRWCPPMRSIWGYLLSNELIPHPFCYIDFEDPDNSALRAIETTKMPGISALVKEEQSDFELQSIPIFGKPNHSNKWKWFMVENQSISLCAYYVQGVGCMLVEQEGYWLIEQSTVFFKRTNKDSYDYKVALSAFPMTVRLEGQPPRDLKGYMLAASNYFNHREYLNSRPDLKIQQNKSQNDDLLFQEQLEGIGFFKAYANNVVVARFEDRTLMTIRSQSINIIAPNGKSLGATVYGTPPKQFKEHLKWLLDWYHKVYHPQEWHNKQEMSCQLENHIRSTETFLHVTSHFQRKI